MNKLATGYIINTLHTGCLIMVGLSSGVILPYSNRITSRKNQSATFSLLYFFVSDTFLTGLRTVKKNKIQLKWFYIMLHRTTPCPSKTDKSPFLLS